MMVVRYSVRKRDNLKQHGCLFLSSNVLERNSFTATRAPESIFGSGLFLNQQIAIPATSVSWQLK